MMGGKVWCLVQNVHQSKVVNTVLKSASHLLHLTPRNCPSFCCHLAAAVDTLCTLTGSAIGKKMGQFCMQQIPRSLEVHALTAVHADDAVSLPISSVDTGCSSDSARDAVCQLISASPSTALVPVDRTSWQIACLTPLQGSPWSTDTAKQRL